MSRWCDQSIPDERNSAFPGGPPGGRSSVWNSHRGNHLGQRSCASAQIGRTYGRKRSDQSAAKHLARRGPSTYGECRLNLASPIHMRLYAALDIMSTDISQILELFGRFSVFLKCAV